MDLINLNDLIDLFHELREVAISLLRGQVAMPFLRRRGGWPSPRFWIKIIVKLIKLTKFDLFNLIHLINLISSINLIMNLIKWFKSI